MEEELGKPRCLSEGIASRGFGRGLDIVLPSQTSPVLGMMFLATV